MRTNFYFNIILIFGLLVQQTANVYSQDKQPVNMQFTRFSTVNGLSQSTINTIIKDKTGFMWFGTADGLNKFDGYNFKIYRNIPGDSTSIPYNFIKTLFVDSKGSLWIGTLGGGLARYDEKSDSFHRYNIGLVECIFEDSKGVIWVGTFDGLFIVNKKTGKAERAEKYNPKYKIFRKRIITAIIEDEGKNLWIGTVRGLYLSTANSSKITIFFNSGSLQQSAISEINTLGRDQNGRLWLGTRDGLYRYDYKSRNFLPARYIGNQENKIIKGGVNSLFCDANYIIWVGTDDGLGRYDAAQGSYNVFHADAFNAQSLSRNSVNSLYADDQFLWVGTALGGVNSYDKHQSLVSHYRIYNPYDQSANTNVVTSFAGNLNGEIWIGTDGGGLFLWNSFNNTFKPFGFDATENSVFAKSVLCLRRSRNGQSLWIGTYRDGLIQLNLKTKKLTRFNTANKALKSNSVYAILEDKKSNIWVGTNGGGVSVINPAGHIVLQLTRDQPNMLTNGFIRALIEDESGRIWIGTYGGINIFDPVRNKFVALKPEADELKKHAVGALFRDINNKIWIGTQGYGLFIYNTRERKLINLTEKQGLSNNNISSIIGDNKGFVWISTSNGINRLPTNKNVFYSFPSDALQTDEFTLGAGYTSDNGNVLFGSVDGFKVFNPANYEKNTVIPNLVITDFQLPANSLSSKKIINQKFNVNDGSPVSLDYNQSVFTIEFAALNFSSTVKNKYACRLEGLEKDWQYMGYERKVTYNNIEPGEYIFSVKAANSEGVWNNKPTYLKIIIHPPLWRTNWAYLLYAITAIFILYSISKEIKTRGKLKNELLFQKLTAEKMDELNRLKMNFFTNVSHELRTPLTLIIDPLRKISEEDITLSQTKSLSVVAFKNASRLLTLVNQLLDFRKFENSLNLEPATVNISDLVNDIVLAFKDRANKRNLELSIVFETEFPVVTVDVDKFQKIIVNLISNAFKFTPDGGKITVTTSTYNQNDGTRQLEIQIEDTGPGIPAAYKTKIFDMFFQLKQTPRFEIESSGIGLALVKELVHLHNGEIFEQGKEGEGSLFVLKLPAGEMTVSESGIATIPGHPALHQASLEEPEVQLKDSQYNHEITILVVEDNVDLRKYITGHLSAYYDVEEASSGYEGYQKAISLIPNLIVSDVMMNEGDGLEFCEKVKQDEKTSHIPVILLTAKQADESKIQGYKSGADAYISKPFNSKLLEIRISNLLESREKLRSSYQSNSADNIVEMMSEIDKQFLEKAEQIILANLLESDFDVEKFAGLLHMNRRQLSRKLKAITDQAPQEYIIHVRLKTAIHLILNQDMNISQAAYHVGFSEPANFSRSFSKVYGQSPKNHLKEKYGKVAL